MPEINALKSYKPNTYYHVYNRGVNKQDVFLDDNDFNLFISLARRYLSNDLVKKKYGGYYPNFYKSVRLTGYCLMPNHYHLMLYVGNQPLNLAKFMGAHQAAFVRIYNRQHGRVGHLFQSRYKARIIEDDADFQSTLDYIHRNPGKGYRTYRYSSVHYYPLDSSKAYIARSVVGMW